MFHDRVTNRRHQDHRENRPEENSRRTFKDHDEALFQSLRLEADYFTIPGPDLGLWGDDIGRAAIIRRTIMGAKRSLSQIAILDHMAWNDYTSLAHIGARMDQPVDLLTKTCRFDWSIYRLFALPANEMTVTNRGPESILPSDEAYYTHLLECIHKGLHVLIFPETGSHTRALRRVLGIENVRYGNREYRQVVFPPSFQHGEAHGCATSVRAEGTIPLLQDIKGEPVLVAKRIGKGAILLAGYDRQKDSLDGEINRENTSTIYGHTFVRLASHLHLFPAEINSHQSYIYKEIVHRRDKDYLLLYSHLKNELPLQIQIRLQHPPKRVLELGSGIEYPISRADKPGWYSLQIMLKKRRGYYLSLHDFCE